MEGGSYVVDLRSDSRKAQQNLSGVLSQIQSGHKADAVNIFTQTFGVRSGDAQKAVDAIERGKGFDASALRIYPNVRRKSKNARIVKVVIGILVVLFLMPVVLTILVFALFAIFNI